MNTVKFFDKLGEAIVDAAQRNVSIWRSSMYKAFQHPQYCTGSYDDVLEATGGSYEWMGKGKIETN